MAAQKIVLKLQVHDEKQKQKALKKVSCHLGIEEIAMDMEEKKLTVIGKVDPVELVRKLRKHWNTEIVTVGPAKDPDGSETNADKNEEGDLIADYDYLNRCGYYNSYNPYYGIQYHV